MACCQQLGMLPAHLPPGRASAACRYVLWPRIDQKTCLKAIQAAGFEPVVIEMRLEGEQLVTDLDELARQVALLGAPAVACILTTTSCFAPRAADDVVAGEWDG